MIDVQLEMSNVRLGSEPVLFPMTSARSASLVAQEEHYSRMDKSEEYVT